MSDARAARAAALNEKRARLEEMKAKRAQRAATGGKGPEKKKADLDDYIDGLLSKVRKYLGTQLGQLHFITLR